MAVKIDKTDLKILKILQEDGRITNLELSNKIGLSPAPTLERVRKLEKSQLINSYHAAVNEKTLGIGIQAFIQVSLVRQLDNAIESFQKKIQEIAEVVECYQVTGSFDYQLKIMVQDIPAFDKLISEKLGKIEEIGQMESYVIISTVKNSKVIPLEYN
ncbi:MAG: Lrp/AsnC family transcriptional regulator [Flavobacteriales bacterium]|nr:Lrp/AsnC family transcriptional regulator [Flavobacteriales bacterium]